MTVWGSLYLPYAGDAAERIRGVVASLGYEAYDPFGGVPGKAYRETVKLFVSPQKGGWTRILGEADDVVAAALAGEAFVLRVLLDGSEPSLTVFPSPAEAGQQLPEGSAGAGRRCIEAFYDDAAAAGAGRRSDSGDAAFGSDGSLLGALPKDVQTMAARVDSQQANKLFARISGQIAGKVGGDPAARDLLRQPDWNSEGGQRISRMMACLGIPDWREPDFVTLRDAYALLERKRRRPNATLYPGDAETMAAVPDALAYIPIYGGRA